MDNKNNRQTKKKRKGGGWWLLFLVFLWAVNGIDGAGISHFFQRLQRKLRTGSIDTKALIAAVSAVVVLVILVIVVSTVAKRVKDKRFDGIRTKRGNSVSVSPMSGQRVQHSHDRLSGYHGEENGFDHWKKQLDGFLEAGIIDRAEYKVLLERRRR
ncbi:MAG: hypothetical protein IJP64_04985 [Oscillospiraceae bacterium]|nr:hypothetical protein [Oscillospiraceae bacterium]